jgi:DNA-binding response OmpR family regulator
MRILVAEDDRPMSQLICTLLRSAGHQPMQAFDGASTLMAAMRIPMPELIVLDLQMPAGDGPTTLTKLRQSSKTALIPVVAISASTDPKQHAEIRALGASTFLQKPLDPDTFIDAVEAFARPEEKDKKRR